MNAACAVCGLEFERETGYFIGAMYFSYALAVAAATPLVVAGLLLGWPIALTGWTSAALLMLLSPWLFRASRVLWMLFDQAFDAR